MNFIALETFYCKETGSWYCKGLKYTYISPEMFNDQQAKERASFLKNSLEKWIDEKKIVEYQSKTEISGG